jgi:hypothetical protein
MDRTPAWRRVMMKRRNQFVKIFDLYTVEVLQTGVNPLIVVDLMGESKMTHGQTGKQRIGKKGS